jgi:hypothetical protein
MALVLGVKVGDVVDVADSWIKVQSVNGPSRVMLTCSDGRKLALRASHMTQLLPDVWVGLGRDLAYSHLRLMFDAPGHVSIVRRRG